ncbi:MAG: CMP-N-acetylneuraminic acid synthetase [Pseudomonadota bacterium]
MKVLALIPARGGSKGIPRKNIKPIAGKPLLVWTIEAALRSPAIDAVVVSTEDVEIAQLARQAGAQVPFMRPIELAQDATPGIDPVIHAISHLPGYDSILLLQPTSPLRETSDIDACLGFALAQSAMSVVSVCEASSHPAWCYHLASDNRLVRMLDGLDAARRQDLPTALTINGAMYFANVDWLCQRRRFVDTETLAYVMDQDKSVDIDTMLDWRIAEMLLKERKQ